MSRTVSQRLCLAGALAFCLATTLTAQTSTHEAEPNGTKAEATRVLSMQPGDCLSGDSNGAVEGALNPAAETADTWEIETAAQPAPGFYRWTLSVTPGNSLSLRGLQQTAGTAVPQTDRTVQAHQESVQWYSNESPSRAYVRIIGNSSSPFSYSACLSVAPVLVSDFAGAVASGSIVVTTVGETDADTDLALFDADRNIIPFHQNDDDPNATGFQSRLARDLVPGTYYLALSDFDLNTSEPAAFDDDYSGGEVMDFHNVCANGSLADDRDLSFRIEDAWQARSMFAQKTQRFEVLFFRFVVTGGGFLNRCSGDGGDQAGCTPCPCGNEAPVGSVGGCLNSSASSARLAGVGSSSLVQADLGFEATGMVPGSFCVLVSGNGVGSLNPSHPCFGAESGLLSSALDGLRCAVGEVQRHGARAIAADGSVGVSNSGFGSPLRWSCAAGSRADSGDATSVPGVLSRATPGGLPDGPEYLSGGPRDRSSLTVRGESHSAPEPRPPPQLGT